MRLASTSKRDNGSCVTFEVAGQAAISADPCKRSFDDPSFWQNDKRAEKIWFDNLDDPAARARGGSGNSWPAIAAVGEDALDERKQRARSFVENQCRAVAILDIGGMDGDAQQEAQRVDEDVALATLDLLARVVA